MRSKKSVEKVNSVSSTSSDIPLVYKRAIQRAFVKGYYFKRARINSAEMLAEYLSISQSTVFTYKSTDDDLFDLNKLGRKPFEEERTKRRILHLARSNGENSFLTQKEIISQCSDLASEYFIKKTLRDALNDGVVSHNKQSIKPYLNSNQIDSRLLYAFFESVKYDYNKVIFGDDKGFQLTPNPETSMLYHAPDIDLPYVLKTGTNSKVLMVWGGVGMNTKLPLYFFNRSVDSYAYISAMQTELLPFMRRNQDQGWHYLQDNAPCHKSHHTIDFFKENNIPLIPHPPSSPDLNIIENVWALLSHKVYHRNRSFQNVEQLKTAIINAWNEITIDEINKFVESMANRINAVVDAEGRQIKY